MQPPRTPDDSNVAGEKQPQGSKITVAAEWLSKIPSIFSSIRRDRDALSSPIKSLGDKEQEGFDRVPRHVLQLQNHGLESEELVAAGEICQTKFAGNEHSGSELRSGFCGNELTEIEQLLKQKFFSRDESTHLIELIQSRMTEIVNHQNGTTRFTGESVDGIHSQRDPHASRKQEDAFQAPYVGSSLVDPHVSRKQEDAYQPPYVGSSPVEIAKAYMGILKSTDLHFHNRREMKKNLFSSDKFGSKVPFSLVKKSPICWPGATVQLYHGYSSSQSLGDSIRPYNSFLGTDSSASLSKSPSKSQGSSRRRKLSDLTSNIGKQPYLPVLEDNSSKRRKYSTFAGITTASPNIHTQKKASTATVLHEGPWLSIPSSSYSSLNTSNALIGCRTTIHENIMQGSSKVGDDMIDYHDEDVERSRFNIGSAVHPQTSRTARKILEYLNTTVPSSREKSLELSRSVSRMRLSQSTKKVEMEGNGKCLNFDPYNKSACIAGREAVDHENTDVQKILSEPSSGSFGIDQSLLLNQARYRESSDSGQSPGIHHSSFKPPEPLEKRGISENGFGFTFPVPAISYASSDPPPTPTIRPAVAVSKMLDSIKGSDPVFSFGSSAVGKRVVFSLDPILCSPTSEMVDVNFNFGSVMMQRLSFSSLEDVVCQ